MVSENKMLPEFLLGLQDILVFVRFKTDHPGNLKILKIANQYIDSYLIEGTIDYKSFKRETYSYCNFESENLIPGSSFKSLSAERIKEIESYLKIIKTAIVEIVDCLEQKNYERTHDLTDAIHALPDALLHKKWNPRSYWKIYIKPYRRRWNKAFLVLEEQELLKFS
ncbi:MAG TPA: hypothetical protein PLZ08_01490 [Bacillota bacterium]|jgi:hypothetical protein|nr:hypothetical protein [Bacillota bacterium]HOL08923.1 hypothetical protein [Bacillota bacterium]HPO96616.1 hypothetical protein [Bacillota bacterium]